MKRFITQSFPHCRQPLPAGISSLILRTPIAAKLLPKICNPIHRVSRGRHHFTELAKYADVNDDERDDDDGDDVEDDTKEEKKSTAHEMLVVVPPANLHLWLLSRHHHHH